MHGMHGTHSKKLFKLKTERIGTDRNLQPTSFDFIGCTYRIVNHRRASSMSLSFGSLKQRKEKALGMDKKN